MRKTFTTLITIVACSLVHLLNNSLAQGTAFTYQGRLNDGPNPAQGIYDLRFTIFDSSAVGAVVAGPQTNSAVAISNGLFAVGLDFGTGVFNGDPRWLQVDVRTNNTGAFTTLTQRQPITAAPYAITAGEATSGNIARLSVSNTTVTAMGVPIVTSGFITGATVTRSGSGYLTPPPVTVNDSTGLGAVITAGISNGAVISLTVQNAGSGYTTNATLIIGAPPSNAYQVFAGTNFFPGVNTLTNANNTFAGAFFGNGAGVTNLNAWRLNGNAGTTPGANFLGTTDNQPLEFQVNGQRVLRLEPTTSLAPNVIGGFVSNAAGPLVIGSVIGGGGSLSGPNFVNESLATVGGGGQNTNVGRFATIGGGGGNNIRADTFSFATIAGGSGNEIRNGSIYSTIGGGGGNVISTNGHAAVIAGGQNNTVSVNGQLGAIAGGQQNVIGTNTFYGTIGGGNNNLIAANSTAATIPGGQNNSATNYAFAAGFRAKAIHDGTFVWADSQSADFASSGPNQFLIRSAGGVGIGTTAPEAALHVADGSAGAVTANANSIAVLEKSGAGYLSLLTPAANENGIIFGNPSASTDGAIIFNSSSTAHGLQFRTGTNVTQMAILANGNVGVGTISPSRELEVQNVSDTEIGIKSTDTGGHLWSLQSSSVSGSIARDASFQIIDRTLNSSRLMINTNGSVGIGTTAPDSPFTIRGTGSNPDWLILRTAADVNQWQINGFGGGLNFAQSFVGDGRLFLANNGNAGIGTITPTNKLHVAGGVSATAFVNTSDRNAKENFAPVSPREVLDKVAALPITTWNYKEYHDGRHIGPMAQDFYAAFHLGGSDKTITTIDPDGVALAAIQGLNQKVESADQKSADRIRKLESENAALTRRLETEHADLKRRLEALETLLISQKSN